MHFLFGIVQLVPSLVTENIPIIYIAQS